MFEIRLKTYYKDGREVETVASAEHFVAVEDEFDMALSDILRGGKVKHFYYLAWLTAQSGLEFKEWLATTRDVDQSRPEEIVPFDPAASAGTSPS